MRTISEYIAAANDFNHRLCLYAPDFRSNLRFIHSQASDITRFLWLMSSQHTSNAVWLFFHLFHILGRLCANADLQNTCVHLQFSALKHHRIINM